MRALQEEMETLKIAHGASSQYTSSYPSYSPPRENRVHFGSPLDEPPGSTMAAAEDLLQHTRSNALDAPATTGRTQSRRLTDYHEHVLTERQPSPPVSPTDPNRYLNTLMEAMREERRESSRQMTALIQALAGNKTTEPTSRINKAIPQVQAMREREDLTEFFQLFEHTQRARNNPAEAWAHTLLPLLNPTCKSLALSLPVAIQMDYRALKTELLALASSQTDQTSKMFWERKKPIGSTWREEVAVLTKLLRRCAPGPTAEEVRGQILVEKLTQMLPRTIQAFVRERKPKTPSEAAELISTYFRAHNITETEWELQCIQLRGATFLFPEYCR